jgi:hypothetical protein
MDSALRDVLEEIFQQFIQLYELTDLNYFFSTVTQYNSLREASLDRSRWYVRGLREV